MPTIHGEKKHESETKEQGCYRTERYFGQFSRSIPLPAEVDIERAEARFDNGVLTIRLPKTKHPDQRMTDGTVRVIDWRRCAVTGHGP